MNIEDCEDGMKVETLDGKHQRTIMSVNKLEKTIDFRDNFGEKHYNPKNYRPVNKFEVGDEVIYKAENGKYYKCIIFGIAEQKDKFDGKYAISFEKGSGRKVNKVVKEKKLSPLKKPDELEVGDKFIDKMGRKQEILEVAYCNPTEINKYFAKRVSDGFVNVFNHHLINEIIYD